jgi:rare lipoprotein A
MHFISLRIIFCLIATPLIACEVKEEKSIIYLKKTFVSKGIACWYGQAFEGKKTSSGEIFCKNKLTAAHPYLEFGTIVRVTNTANNKCIDVEINDRGPVSKKRILDLSEIASKKIDLYRKGTGLVYIEICGYRKVNLVSWIKHYNNILAINYNEKRN